MINITDKEKCCGCEACVQKCPQRCIYLQEDEEGFLYPKVNIEDCISCGLCRMVCPIIHQGEEHTPISVFAAKNNNQDERFKSSSGGIFSLLVERVMSEGGVVFGAAFNDRWEVWHSYADSLKVCEKFKGSKYVQSRIGDSYQEAEAFLKEGRSVLFSGTPCQISGLKGYLRHEYDNLLTVDVICHGVPSPGMFRWYLYEEMQKVACQGDGKNSVSFRPIHSIPKWDALESVKNVEIKGISFRDKTKGWKKFSFALDLAKTTADGKKNTVSLSYTQDKNPFMKGFLRNLYLRPSCYDCPDRDLKSGSDITLGDFWGIGRALPSMDDDKGVSAVLLNTEKGARCFNELDVEKVLTNYDVIRRYNNVILRNPAKPKKRKLMFCGEDGFIERVNRLAKPSLKIQLKKIIKTIIGRK